jgi:histone acetyltransferase 1
MEMDGDELEEQIKKQVEEWSSNSNECFTIDILQGDGSTVATFQPEFTYPIFGEEEAIFGYQGLSINLTFAAHNLRPHLAISYDRKFKAQGTVAPTNILEALQDFLPKEAFSNQDANQALQDPSAAQFTPPGEKVREYSRDGLNHEIWCANLSDPAAKALLENMQVLVPMFIEGGQMLQLEQDWTTQRWKLFLLYRVHPKPAASSTYSQYSLLGYGTSYRVFTFPDRHSPLQIDLDLFSPSNQSLDDFLPPPQSMIPNDLAPTAMPNNIDSPLKLPSRERLSQFLILPPYQRAGHGQELYNTMYSSLAKDENVREFTVEDPNEAFDDLRDLCDLLHLRAHYPEFAALRINTEVPPEQLHSTSNIPVDTIVPIVVRDRLRQQTKIMPRQFDRLVEMQTLSFIPPLNRSRSRITRKEKATNQNDKAYYFWRLYVKQRLYIFNRDQLAQVEHEERIEKLESALDSVLEAYGKMIERVEAREAGARVANGNGSPAVAGAASTAPRARKRKVIEDVDDDEEDDEERDGDGTSETLVAVNGHKKARVE